MNPRIKTYEDLLQEEKRLQAEVDSYKIVIKEDITALKESLNPVKRTIATVKNIFTMENNGPLINFGLNFGMDVLVRKVLLARAGWITKFVVPFVAKNFASHIIGDEDKSRLVKSFRRMIKMALPKKVRKEATAIVTA